MIKGAVFDLDHTLFDRYSTLRKIMPLFCEHFDIAEGMTVERAGELMEYADKNFVHIGWEKIYDYFIKNGVFRTVPEFDEYCEFMFAQFRSVAVEFDFTKPMLTSLRESGIKTGLITNGKSITQRAKLAMMGLEPYFDEIIISGELGAAKPSPVPFTEMAARLCLDPSELMYVGDHPKFDVDASRSVGYTPVWIMTTGTWVYPEIEKPSLRLEDVSTLPELIERLNAAE